MLSGWQRRGVGDGVDPFEPDRLHGGPDAGRCVLVVLARLVNDERPVILEGEQRVVRPGLGATPVLVTQEAGLVGVAVGVEVASDLLEVGLLALANLDVGQNRRHR